MIHTYFFLFIHILEWSENHRRFIYVYIHIYILFFLYFWVHIVCWEYFIYVCMYVPVILTFFFLLLWRQDFLFDFFYPNRCWNVLENLVLMLLRWKNHYHVMSEPINLIVNLRAVTGSFNSKNISIFKIICSDNSLCYFRAPYIAKKGRKLHF